MSMQIIAITVSFLKIIRVVNWTDIFCLEKSSGFLQSYLTVQSIEFFHTNPPTHWVIVVVFLLQVEDNQPFLAVFCSARIQMRLEAQF